MKLFFLWTPVDLKHSPEIRINPGFKTSPHTHLHDNNLIWSQICSVNICINSMIWTDLYMVIKYTSVYICVIMCINNRYLWCTHFLWASRFASYLWSIVVIEKAALYYLHTEYENGAASQIITPMPFPQSNEIIIICVCVFTLSPS